MDRTRKTLLWIWLGTTVLAALVTGLAYRAITRVPDFAGRTDPAVVWNDPTALFREPGLLGTAVEMQVTEAVRACMEERGFTFRAPAVAESIYGILDPARDGYGIAAGGDTPRPVLGSDGPTPWEEAGYEEALYGAALGADGGPVGGCAAAGYQALTEAIATLENLPYTIEQLEADALADPVYAAAAEEWVACMAERGYTAASPEDLMADLAGRLSQLSGEAARALAEEERRIAADDFDCRRRTIDPATLEVAERLAPVFVERNRPQLEALIPPTGEPEGPPDLPEGLGSGDVQVTLLWTSKADLDLLVTDPAGERVYYRNPAVASGGTLDRDANFPCGTDDSSPAAENVFWPRGGAPAGTYLVVVAYTADCLGEGEQAFDLIVQVGGAVVHRDRHTVGVPGELYEFEFTVGAR